MKNELLMSLRKDDAHKQLQAKVVVVSINAEMEGGDAFESILGGGDFTEAVNDKIDLERMLDKLPSRQKRILIMRNLRDMSQQQIGDIEHCSRSRVSRLITTAKEQLNKDYKDIEGKEEEQNGNHHRKP